jgi:ribonuclease VapC
VIVDTSALVAIFNKEDGYIQLTRALSYERSFLIAPALVEFHRVTAGFNNIPRPEAVETIENFRNGQMAIIPFELEDGELAVAANPIFGSGGGTGQKLNMLDLMVYAAAKARDLPILCTGYDFLSTDARIHPASRRG